jgi:branched-chain amino acid transport system substrate-binding protein
MRYPARLAAMGAMALATLAPSAMAVANEQFIPVLSYRTGLYAANGIPWANGFVDYLQLVNLRDGGINGVKIAFEECETAYGTDRGVECYERLKGKGPTGAAMFHPVSTGITFALTEKAPVDKIPMVTVGYGRSDTRDGSVFRWNFPLIGSHWTAAGLAIEYLGREVGGKDKLKGKKIVLLHLDAPAGREPIAVFEKLAAKHGYTFTAIPVTAPGLEQRSQWLQIRQMRPDYVVLWGYGGMNPAAIQEAAAVNFPRDRLLGYAWSGAEPDVIPAGDRAKSYKTLMLQHGAERDKVHQDILTHVYGKGAGLATPQEVGQILYNRGLISALVSVEAIRTAQAKFGNKPLTGEQVRWGLENLDLDAGRLQALGVATMIKPLKASCENHEGARFGRVQQWDGARWTVITDWIEVDGTVLDPLVKESAAAYASSKGITPVDCGKL